MKILRNNIRTPSSARKMYKSFFLCNNDPIHLKVPASNQPSKTIDQTKPQPIDSTRTSTSTPIEK